MGLEFVFDVTDAGLIASGIVGVAGLVWLLRASRPSPVRNAFAAVLLLISLNVGLYNFYWNGPGGRSWWVAELPDNVIAVTILHFLWVWLATERGTRVPKWAPLPFIAVGLATTALWFAKPEWRYEYASGAQFLERGGIFIAENVLEVAAGVAVAVVFMRAAIRRDSILLALASLGFLWSLAFGSFALPVLLGRTNATDFASDGQRLLELLSDVSIMAGALYVIGAALYFWARAERNRARAVVIATVLGMAASTFAFGIMYVATDHRGWVIAYRVVGGLTNVALAIFGAMLFVVKSNVGHESRVWLATRRGALPAMMLVTFFVVSEGAQAFFAGRVGPMVGILATAPLILAIHPIQRLGDRFGHVVAPGKKEAATHALHDQEALYERQVRFAWADGRIGANERARLVDLRKSLGISAERAETIEQAVVTGLP